MDLEYREIVNLNFKSLFDVTPSTEVFWKLVCSVKRGDDTLAFPFMKKFVFCILSLPNSSANVERTFSQINLNKTKTRNCLAVDTLEGIMHCKSYLKLNDSDCVSMNIENDLYKKMNSNIYK